VREAKHGTLILGGGFAGSYVARLLGRDGATMVSLENYMLYTPMLVEAASGTLEPRHTVVPLRVMCPHAELILGRIGSLDRERNVLRIETDSGTVEIHFVRLVIALGAVIRTVPIPGLEAHGLGFKSLGEAIYLRNHVLRQLEEADAQEDRARAEAHLTFVFIGAGYAGVEAVGELSDLVHDALRFYPRLHAVRQHWLLADAATRILPEIPTTLGEYAASELRRRGVDIRVSTRLESVDAHSARLSDGTTLETETVVWTAGVRPSPLLAEFGLPLDERGRVRVDRTLRVVGLDHVFALGDCAAVPNAATPGQVDPPTCQHALRQARRLARNLRSTPGTYRYRMLGQVATLGRYKGIAQVLGLRFRGFPGWLITRTYHLYQLPLASRKLRVVADWTVSLFFRRDIVEIGPIGQPAPLSGRPTGS
jgi:NADH:ubiquinone reductase (H+-translocating)